MSLAGSQCRCPRCVVGTIAVVMLCAPIAGRADESVPSLLAAARSQADAGRFDEAAATMARAIDLARTDDERAMRWTQLADLYAHAGRYVEQADALAHALPFVPPYDPRHWPLVERMLDLYCNYLERPAPAIALLESEVAGLPPGRGDLRAWVALAWTRLQIGETDWARDVFRVLMRFTRDGGPLLQRTLRGLDFSRGVAPEQVSFPRNLETAALLGQFQARIREEKWSEAADCISALLTRYGDVVMDAPATAGVGTRVVAERMLAALPPSAQSAYVTSLDPLMRRVIAGGRSEEIERLLYTQPLSATRSALLGAAGDAMLAEGRYSRASLAYRQAAAAGSDAEAIRRLRVLAARAAILAQEPIPADTPRDGEITVAGRARPLADVLAEWQADATAVVSLGAPPPSTPTAAFTSMRHDALRLVQAPLALRKWQAGWQPDHTRPNPRMTDAFCPYVPVGDRQHIFINTSEMVYAVDPVAERVLWARGPSERFVAEVVPPLLREARLTNAPKRFRAAVSADAVFYRLTWAARATEQPRSAVFACRRTDGVLLWSTEGRPELNGLLFITDPAYADGTIVAAAWEPTAIPTFHVIGLDATTGEPLYRTPVFSGVAFPALRDTGLLDTPLGSAPPALVDGRVYYAPGMGVLACVDLFDGHVHWLQTYPRVFEFGPDEWAGRLVLNKPGAAVMVHGDVILAAPPDYLGLLVFDRASGKLLRQYASRDFRALVGVKDKFALVQDDGAIVAIGLDDARVAWKGVVPANTIIGTATLSPRGILVPTERGVFILSPDDGHVVEHRPRDAGEPIGNLLDLGERLIGASPSSVHVYAAEVTGGRAWRTPHNPPRDSTTVDVAPPGGLVRWALPAPDRNDFFLSEQTPGLMVIRSWETYELRRTEPAPTLLWEYPSRGWPGSIQFDAKTVVLGYPDGMLVAIDVATGRTRWEHGDASMAGDRGAVPAVVAGDHILWFKADQLQVLNAADGKMLWSTVRTQDVICGVCPQPEGVGVFLGGGSEPVALLLETTTGKELRRISLWTEPAADARRPISVARSTTAWSDTLTSAPVALLDGRYAAIVDFAQGTSELRKISSARGTGLQICGDTLCVRSNERLIAASRLSDGQSLSVVPSSFWCVADGIEYFVNGAVVTARDMATKEQVWVSKPMRWKSTSLVATGAVVLVALTSSEKDARAAQIVALDRKTGEVVDQVQCLAREFHRVDLAGESMMASDLGYLYRFGPPRAEGREAQRVRMPSDPEAVAALAIARDQQRDHVPPPPLAAVAPVVDGDLSEWQGAQWMTLAWPDNWLPDFVLLSPEHPRHPLGSNDASADVAIALDAHRAYVAVRVRDDVHDASPWRPLWRGDSVHVVWRPVRDDAGPGLHVTVACVDHVPCVQLGPPSAPVRSTTDTSAWPAWMRGAVAAQDVPWLRRWGRGGLATPGVQAGVRRDDEHGETTYELAVPLGMLPGAGTLGVRLLWNVEINDADGDGREGSLTLGTAPAQLERPVGFASWPAAP